MNTTVNAYAAPSAGAEDVVDAALTVLTWANPLRFRLCRTTTT
jgi:hypothetical protein